MKKQSIVALNKVRHFHPDVRTVADATRPTTVEITKADNESSAVKKHKDCALAVACKRKLNADGAIIGIRTAYIVKGTHATRYRLLESTSREIVSFDRNGGFAEGVYPLIPPSKWEKLGSPRKVTNKRGHAKRRHGITYRHHTAGVRTELTMTPGVAIPAKQAA